MNTLTQSLQNFDWAIAMMIFIAYIVIDALSAQYTLDVSRYKAMRAASTGSFIHLLLAFGVLNYTQNWLYILPLISGSWIGTFLVVRRPRKE